jgi:DNA-directed RNA polymerase specialized sigma24 family protein
MINPDERIGEYEKVVATAAYRFRKAAEYDDLYQEGMIAVWLCPPDASPQYISQAVYNRMKNWVRYIKRLRHNHSVDYEEIVDGLQDRNSREHAEELLYDEGSFRSDIL